MNRMKAFLPNDKILPWFIALVGMLFVGVLLPINIVPADDAAGRYIPMARAFAEGNWNYAFHPHSGVLFSSLSGLIHLLPGIGAFRACQLAALLLWGASLVPLYHIALHIWHERSVAVICAILYLLCSHLQRFVYDGIRDNGRSLGFFLVILGILIAFENKDSWRSAVISASGAAILMMIRVDCVVFGVAGIGFFVILDIKNHGWHCWRSWTALCLCVMLIAPQLYLNYIWSGYPVPNSRYAILCHKMGLPPLGGQK